MIRSHVVIVPFALAVVLGTHEITHAEDSEPSGSMLRLEEVVVEAKRPLSAASSDEIRAQDYELRPHRTTQEILNNVPGLVVAQHQGGGKATQYLIRGFDADHGTDFAVFVDDLPVNLPTHAHGQGYADLNFLIPETVDRLQLYKGPYFVQFGDFATAGALNVVTKEEFDENFALAEGGSFATHRYVVGASPRLGDVKTLLAGQAYFTDGPFEDPEDYSRYNGFAKFTVEPSADSKLALAIDAYDGRWHGSGQIPLRAVHSGLIDRFGSIDPTEGGKSDRENLNLHYAYTPSPADSWTFQLYGSRYKLALYTDFTFFKDTGLRFVRNADGSIVDTADGAVVPGADYVPGDGILQNDQRYLYGGRARWTHYWAVHDVPLQTQLGVETRHDDIHVALQRQVRRRPFFTVDKLGVLERSFSGYLQQQVFADRLDPARGRAARRPLSLRRPQPPAAGSARSELRPGPDRRQPDERHRQPESEPDRDAGEEHRPLSQLRQGVSLERRTQRPALEGRPATSRRWCARSATRSARARASSIASTPRPPCGA